MADTKDSVLDKAESFARRVLDRLGSKVDAKIFTGDQRALSLRAIGNFTSRIEKLIESSLEEDEHGIRRVAPNRFKVLFTYEETSTLSPQYIEAMGKELTAMVFEYINNRRYVTRGPVEVETGKDVFAKESVLKASFDDASARAAKAVKIDSAKCSQESRLVSFTGDDGQCYRVELKREGAPVYIGRAGGSGLRIDDPSVSRLHCSLSLRDGGEVIIADVGSANGTFVNGHLLGADRAHSLKHGDVVGVGDFKFIFSESK